jgi:hypothetical protein
VYIQDLDVITKIIEAWDIIKASGNPCNNDEIAYALYLDKLHGEWIGDIKYYELYEPTGICSLNKKGIWINTNAQFIHYLGSVPRRFRW